LPQLMAATVGFMYGGNRVATYGFLKKLYSKEQIYTSIINKLDAAFALGFIFSWGIFGALVILGQSWLLFFSIMVVCLLFAIVQMVRFQYITTENTLDLGVVKEQKSFKVKFSAIIKSIPAYLIQFVKDLMNSAIEFVTLVRNSMVQIFLLCTVFLSMIQVHFMKCIVQVGEQYINIPNLDTYFIIIAMLSLFLGRIFASFLLRIFRTIYVVAFSLTMLGLMILSIALASTSFDSEGVIHFQELPSAIWMIPAMGFVWAPVMPTLCATAFFHLENSKAYTLAGIAIIAIFGTEVIADGFSTLIFKQFSFHIALLLGLVPVVLLMIFSFLFLNDLKQQFVKNEQ
jgi:MFS family permease